MVQFLFALGWTKNIQEEQEAQLMLQLTLIVDTMAVVNLNAEEPFSVSKELDFHPNRERAELKWDLADHNRHIVLTD